MKRSMAANVPNVRDDKVWNDLTAGGTEPGSGGRKGPQSERRQHG